MIRFGVPSCIPDQVAWATQFGTPHSGAGFVGFWPSRAPKRRCAPAPSRARSQERGERLETSRGAPPAGAACTRTPGRSCPCGRARAATAPPSAPLEWWLPGNRPRAHPRRFAPLPRTAKPRSSPGSRMVGVLYAYMLDCRSSISSHTVPELINKSICWNGKGGIETSIGPVQYRFTIPSLRAQCTVTRSVPRYALSASLLAIFLVSLKARYHPCPANSL